MEKGFEAKSPASQEIVYPLSYWACSANSSFKLFHLAAIVKYTLNYTVHKNCSPAEGLNN